MNSVNIIGRLADAVELRYTPSGKAVANITLAVDDGFGDNKKTLWIGCTLWGKTAEIAQQHAVKGQKLGITGRLSQEEYEDKATGKKVRKTHVTAENLDLLEKPKGESQGPPPARDARGGQQVNNSGGFNEEEDIPFAPFNPI